MKVVVLAGGKGSRLGLNDIPKVMVPVDGIPLLERTVRAAVADGFVEFLFLTGHLGDVIERHFSDGIQFGAKIEYVRELQPLGTAGCFRQVADRLSEPFIVVYGDVLMDVDLRAFATVALEKGGAGTLFAHPNDHPFDSDLLEVDTDERIIAVHPKPHPPGDRFPNLVSAALYVLSPVALGYIDTDGPADWGRDIFPRLVKSEALYSYRSCEYIKDIGTPERLANAERHLIEGRVERLALRTRKSAIFLDRDGVINEERGGVHSPRDVRLIPGAAQAIRSFNEAGVPVICVTNQPDLAKGKMTWSDLRAVSGEIDCQLAQQASAYIDETLLCPHHPQGGWPGEVVDLKVQCECRKPADGLLRRAARTHNIDLSRSWMIGDRYCDVVAASSAGARSVLVQTGHAGNDRYKYSAEPDKYCQDLSSAAEFVLKSMT